MLSSALFYLGDYSEALTYAQRAYSRNTPVVRRAHIVRSGFDRSIWAGCVVAQILWLQGLLDQSAQAARDVLTDAEAGGHPVSLCIALTWSGCTISLRLGDIETAENSIARLKDQAEAHALGGYYACGLAFEGQLSAKRGDIAGGERLLRAGLDRLQYEIFSTPFLSGLAEVLAMAGGIDESLAAAEEALRRTERNDSFWWTLEALRIKGDVLLLSDRAYTTATEDHFRRSLELAHRQGALSWQLRAAMSLARLRRDQGRTEEARDLLSAVYGRFTEGFGTADLKTAKRLLEELIDVDELKQVKAG